MSSEQFAILEKIIVIMFIASLFADFVLRATWNKAYFTFGLPIFVMRIPVDKKYKGVPFQYLFEEEFQAYWLMPSLAFKQKNSRVIFFHEKLFENPKFRYIAVMHGLIIFEHEKQQVVIKGVANWLLIWIIFYFASRWLNLSGISFEQIANAAIIILVGVISYSIQSVRFSKVGKYAAQLCSSKHFLHNDGG